MAGAVHPPILRRRSCPPSLLLLLLLPILFPAIVGRIITNKFGLRETDLHQQASDCRQLDEDCRTATHETQVCGDNGETYRSMCLLRTAICRRDNVSFKHEGACTVAEKCLDKRRAALEDSKRKQGIYVPDCRPDGTFEPMQCHRDTGFCWCASPDGRFTGSNTANGVRIKDLNCSSTIQAGRGPPVESPNTESTPHPCVPNSRLRRCISKGCSVIRRSAFIDNMSKHILNEYNRLPEAADAPDPQTSALIWKFNQLDKNSNGQLGRREYKDLKRLVRRNVKPKVCSKDFPLLCDADNNKRVSLTEWQSCWESPLQPLPTSTTKRPEVPNPNRRSRAGNGRPTDRPKARSSCVQDRQNALRQAASSSTNDAHFVPECDARGRYRRYQCFGSMERRQWFCFCVSVRTGKSLKGTAVKLDSNSSTPLQCKEMELPPKDWPGCKKPKRARKFWSALLSYFNSITSNGSSPEDITTTDGRRSVVHKLFLKLDANGNNKLDRQEKKQLRTLVKKKGNLKRCGRHIQKVCDADDDGEITSLELRTCLSQPPRGRRPRLPEGDDVTDSIHNIWNTINPFDQTLYSIDK